MGPKGKYSSWEKVAKALEAAERERAARRESSKPTPKSSPQPRWVPVDTVESLKHKLAKHKAHRETVLSVEPAELTRQAISKSGDEVPK